MGIRLVYVRLDPRTSIILIMASSIPHTVVLTRHLETLSQAVHEIEAHVAWTEAGELAITYILKGDLTCLRIPEPQPPRRADRLWEHTCFEVFVGVKDKTQYCEFNCAPSGEWAVYTFRRYRDGGSLDDEGLAPKITVRSTEDSLELDAIIRLDRVPTIQPRARLRLALSAVVEEENGVLSYWALKHPPGKPDFHHPDSFALEFAPLDAEATNVSTVSK